jgi:endonuclease G
MNKARKLAFYTAVNIDGARLRQIPRSGDRWYFDPRIDRELQSGPELYANNDLDRGHLVRRLDPVWGSEAARANEHTFHFTNASPQHRNLNQKTWLELEDYILDNAGRHDIKVTVFTGPVFREDDMLYRGRFRIPAEFWKVVAMVRPDGVLSATAYLQTQKNLLDDLEFAFGSYKTYQVPVERIEHLTSLDFGSLRSVDPLAGQESVFAGIVIEGPQDIRLGHQTAT